LRSESRLTRVQAAIGALTAVLGIESCSLVVWAGILVSLFPACPVPQGMAGLFCWAVCAHRVVVFIDYQNVYHLARSAFGHEGNPDKNVGHVRPLKVGGLLCDLGRSSLADRELCGVRVHQGLPDTRSGADLVRFTSRQMAGWQRSAGVVVRTRPLAYQQSTAGGRTVWRAQEKGVDVMLAVDVVDMARTDAYDTAVVFSADTDLLPALEAAVEIGKRVETATWRGPGDNRGPLRIKQRNLWNHYLDHARFDQVRDDTDYLASAATHH